MVTRVCRRHHSSIAPMRSAARARRRDARTSRRARRARGTARADRGSSRCRHATALAPASSISTASTPVCTPPVPITGTSGSARVTSCTARNATGLIAGPDRPPPPPPRTGRRVSASTSRPEQGVHEREPGGAGVDRRARDRGEIGHVRRQLREHGQRRAPRRRPPATTLAVASGSCANICRRVAGSGSSRSPRSRRGRRPRAGAARSRSRSRRPCAPTPTRSHARPTARSAGRSCSIHAVDARALQADRVEHPGRRSCAAAARACPATPWPTPTSR